MTWLGEFQLGDRLPLTLWVRDDNGVPILPDDPPRAIVASETEFVDSLLLPIFDTSETTGLFHSDINLDGKYGQGPHVALYFYTLSTVAKCHLQRFEILPGGDGNGTGTAMTYFAVSPISYLVVQNDNGNLLRRKNPRVS